MDGGSGFKAGRRLGGRPERRHLPLSRSVVVAQRAEEADHRALELSEGRAAVHGSRASVLPQEFRPAEAVATVRTPGAGRIADTRDRSERALARRQHVALRHGGLPRRKADGLHDVGRGRRLADHPGARSVERQGSPRPREVDAILRAVVDQGFEGFFLFTLPGAARRQGPRSGAVGTGALLPSGRDAPVRRPPDLRA